MRVCNFTPEALRVLCLARQNACAMGHSYVGSEHLLLALAGETESMVSVALRRRGLEEGRLRRVVTEQMGLGRPDGMCQGLTVRCRHIIALATAESAHMGAQGVAPEHLLLGLLRDGGGSGAERCRHSPHHAGKGGAGAGEEGHKAKRHGDDHCGEKHPYAIVFQEIFHKNPFSGKKRKSELLQHFA